MTQALGTWLLPSEVRELGALNLARRYAELGFGMRFVVYADKVEFADDAGDIALHDWTNVDESMQAFKDAGMPPEDIYVNVVGAPQHWCNGATTYMEGITSKCRTWNPDKNSRPPILYDPTLPECANPPKPDRNMQISFYTELVNRYKDVAKLFGVGNEPDDPLNPLGYLKTVDPKGDWEPSADRAFDEWSLPFAQAARAVKPDIVLCGPECATYGYARTMIDRDNMLGLASAFRVFDILSVHDYAGTNPFPSGALSRISIEPGNLLAYFPHDVLAARKLAFGEVGIENGEDPMLLLAYMGAVWSMGLFEFVCLMIGDFLFKRSPAGARTTEPTDVYDKIQKLMQQMTSRHRAVRF